ncbi:tRNA pseudouridine(13) synthase TruD [Vreelandella lionensis]|uniref:tRNA pseudouridine(13) synthase TruD n=1 Tax=Vreelandella lionensis TaxID=1144478 RepID=UPI002436C70A|nr:tRNA pseudouridine(13) synthase TruD [Halomonas lionensis]
MLNLPPWHRSLTPAFGVPAPGQYRAQPEDFIVDEQLDFTPEAHGEHLWLRLEKRNQTTLDMVKQLSRLCGVTPRDIGYSGMKDRVAVARQWLSVHLPGRDAPADLSASLAALGVTVLEQARHPRKLKRGVHRTNHFTLRLSGEAVQSAGFLPRLGNTLRSGRAQLFRPSALWHRGAQLTACRRRAGERLAQARRPAGHDALHCAQLSVQRAA